MNKIIIALLGMLLIFPIANADGKILLGSEVLTQLQDTKLMPESVKEIDYFTDSDTIKNEKSTEENESEKEIAEAIESAAIISSGVVSWYGGKFHGRKTASGEKYDKHELTAAHKSLPFGTKVKVTNTRNGKSVVVEINDRGPYVGSRVLDLSQAAFNEIGHTNTGVMHVEYETLEEAK